MPIENLARNHFSEAEKQQLDEAVQTILSIISPHTYNLNAKERSQYGKVGEQKKLLINKVRHFQQSQPNLASPDVNWEEFEADYQTRTYAENKLNQLKSALLMMLSIKILHDHDNYKDALQDYRYAAYRSKFNNQVGHLTKMDSLKGFFPKTGKKKKKED